ncbi:MAG: hypothetical protein N2662_08785 [Bacteroidales bacterium]|nr:hypothetical protein [Bacteroidales bacterium]
MKKNLGQDARGTLQGDTGIPASENFDRDVGGTIKVTPASCR